MDTLVIDSATEACSVALIQDGTAIAGDHRMLGRGHAEQLVPMIAALPGRGRAARIAVALGPGSFTGLRVGLAAARALAFAWNVPLVGYPTLGLIAAQALGQRPGQSLAVATTGGHGEWFVQEFGADGRATTELASLAPAAAAAAITAPLAAGSQAAALIAARGHGEALALWPDARAFPLLDPVFHQTPAVPLYGRAPDARLPVAHAAVAGS